MRRIVFVLVAALLAVGPALASPGHGPEGMVQAAQDQDQRRPPAPNFRAENIRLDLRLTDTYTGSDSTKSIALVLRNGGDGQIRTANVLDGRYQVQLNVDASVQMISGTDRIRVNVTFEYTPVQLDSGRVSEQPAQLDESLSVYLTSGEPLLVSQSADPVTDRRVTVELTATVLQ